MNNLQLQVLRFELCLPLVLHLFCRALPYHLLFLMGFICSLCIVQAITDRLRTFLIGSFYCLFGDFNKDSGVTLFLHIIPSSEST